MNTRDFKRLVEGTRCWYIHTSGPKAKFPIHYIRRNDKNGHVHLHREVLNIGKFTFESIVDHKDHDGLNCRRSNLRVVNSQGNSANRRGRVIDQIYSHRGVSITKFERNGYAYFQAYHKNFYYGCSSSLERLKDKIDIHLKDRRV